LTADALNGEFNMILTEDLARLFRGREFAPEIYKHLLFGEIELCTMDGLCTMGGNSLMLQLSGNVLNCDSIVDSALKKARVKTSQAKSDLLTIQKDLK
jgi:hypothetical protein